MSSSSCQSQRPPSLRPLTVLWNADMLEIKVEEMFEKQVQKAAVIKSERKSAQSRDMRSGTNVI